MISTFLLLVGIVICCLTTTLSLLTGCWLSPLLSSPLLSSSPVLLREQQLTHFYISHWDWDWGARDQDLPLLISTTTTTYHWVGDGAQLVWKTPRAERNWRGERREVSNVMHRVVSWTVPAGQQEAASGGERAEPSCHSWWPPQWGDGWGCPLHWLTSSVHGRQANHHHQAAPLPPPGPPPHRPGLSPHLLPCPGVRGGGVSSSTAWDWRRRGRWWWRWRWLLPGWRMTLLVAGRTSRLRPADPSGPSEPQQARDSKLEFQARTDWEESSTVNSQWN